MRPAVTQAQPAPTRAATPLIAQARLPVWLMAALLVLVTLALYWPATRYDFVNFDDNQQVTSNLLVQRGLTWEGLKWVFLNPVPDNWHPLTVLSHMAVCQACGLNPWGHHLANVLLHALNAGLVFALLQQMTGARWRSLLVAVLFAVHPLRVESVAWVTERKDVLSGFFGLLALMAYARYTEAQSLKSKVQSPKSVVHPPSAVLSTLRSATEDGLGRTGGPWSLFPLPSSIFYLLSLFLFALGLMSKPTLVTWPCVMLLLDYWPLGRMQNAECRMQNTAASDTQHATRNTPHVSRFTFHVSRTVLLPLFVEKLPFFALSAISSVVTFVVQQREGALAANESLPLGARVGNALISYGRYLGKTFWPTDLAVFYPHPGYWPLGKVVLAGGLILGISVVVWVQRRRAPYLLMGWLWYCGTLVPVSQVIQTGCHAMGDRFTYVPLIGVLLALTWGAYELTRCWRYQVLALSVAGGATLLLCLGLTRQQLGYWQDSESLFRHALAVTENNWLAHYNVGAALGTKGQIDEAIRQFQEALRLKPDYAEAHNNLGAAFEKKDQIDEAIRQYQEAIRLRRGYADAHNNLGTALDKKGQIDEAIRQFQEAIRLKPDHANAHYDLGIALVRKGQIDEAIRQFQEAIRLKPDYTDAHNGLGVALDKRGKTDEAIRQFQEAIHLKPDYADAHNNLGIALGRKGQTDEAISQFQEALRLKPDHADAHNNLGYALGRKGQIDEAIRQFQDAIRLQPGYADAHNNLGIALAQKGQMDEAISQFQQAIRLKPGYADAQNNLAIARASKTHSPPPPGAPTGP
jgi:Flp pilus assembly protein TadD